MESKSIDIKKVAELVSGIPDLLATIRTPTFILKLVSLLLQCGLRHLKLTLEQRPPFANKPNLMMRNSAQIKLPCQR
jgi:hypothetical protein